MYRVAKGRRVRIGGTIFPQGKRLPDNRDYSLLEKIGDVEEVAVRAEVEDISPVRIRKERVQAFNDQREANNRAKKKASRRATKKADVQKKAADKAMSDQAQKDLVAELLPDQPDYDPKSVAFKKGKL